MKNTINKTLNYAKFPNFVFTSQAICRGFSEKPGYLSLAWLLVGLLSLFYFPLSWAHRRIFCECQLAGGAAIFPAGSAVVAGFLFKNQLVQLKN
jgi:hypothetical protein